MPRKKTNECVQDGNACTKNEDCCNFGAGKVGCIGGICTPKGPA